MTSNWLYQGKPGGWHPCLDDREAAVVSVLGCPVRYVGPAHLRFEAQRELDETKRALRTPAPQGTPDDE